MECVSSLCHLNHARRHFKPTGERELSWQREGWTRLKQCPTLEKACIKFKLMHNRVRTTSAALRHHSVLVRHEKLLNAALLPQKDRKGSWLQLHLLSKSLTDMHIHDAHTWLFYLVVQLQQLLFIAACFVLLRLIQLSDFPQLFSQFPHLLLQSLLITTPWALCTQSTHVTTKTYRGQYRWR